MAPLESRTTAVALGLTEPVRTRTNARCSHGSHREGAGAIALFRLMQYGLDVASSPPTKKQLALLRKLAVEKNQTFAEPRDVKEASEQSQPPHGTPLWGLLQESAYFARRE